MGRDMTKTVELDLDYSHGIRKVCNGNLKYFFDKWVTGTISITDFYHALKYRERVTPEVEQAIEEAYFAALSELHITHDEISIMPTFEKGLQALANFLGAPTNWEQFAHGISMHEKRLLFYLKLVDLGLITVEKTKKSQVV